MKIKNALLLIGLSAILFASIAFNLKQFIQSRKDQQRMELLSKNTTAGNAKIVTRYVHDSIEHAVIKEVPVMSTAEKEIAVGSGYIDTLTQAFKIAVNRLDEATKVNAQLIAENIALKRDSGTDFYTYNDKYLSLTYKPDSNKIDLRYDVSLNIAKYWKRSWLLGDKQHYIDIFSDDQRVRINSVKRFSIAEKKQKHFGLGVNASYSYLPFVSKWEPTLGIGFQYNFIQF